MTIGSVDAATPDLATVDLTDPRWHAGGPPHELFARMRTTAPVRWNALPDGEGAWALTRHADISAISRDHETFSTAEKGIFIQPDQVMPLEVLRSLLLFKDPPEHTKYRAILQRAFTPHAVATLEDAVRARVDRAIDTVIESGSCDIVADITTPVPLGVLAELLGLPASDIERLQGWTDALELALHASEPATAGETFVEMATYLHEQIRVQAESGNEDSLVMRLRTAEVDGRPLDDAEILTFFSVLVFAGNDTTRNTASLGTLALLEHPDALAQLQADPEGIPAAVEEILRWTTVVQYFIRTALRDTEIAGQAIAAGERVMLWYSAASRDEAVFDAPERFDITRDAAAHKAFGGGGRHFCLGAGLARLELRVIFEQVTRRMSNLELAGDPVRFQSSWVNALTSLPVRFDPGPRVG